MSSTLAARGPRATKRRPCQRFSSVVARPTCCRSADLVAVLDGIRERFGLRRDAEVTTEANPDSVTPRLAARARRAAASPASRSGCSRRCRTCSRTLERTHDPDSVARGRRRPREAAGLQVSVDLIYGTPGESLDDWRRSLDAAVALEPDHVSAYALVVEDGTKLAAPGAARRVVPAPEDDDEADKYELADELLAAAGYGWYEVSNWARATSRPLPPQRRATGAATTGGASARARTATSAACAGGTSSTPARMPRGSPRGSRPPQARETLDRRAARTTSGCCSARACVDGLPVDAI